MDFLLAETPPMPAPPASNPKARREDKVPLRSDVAGRLRAYFADKPAISDVPAFSMPKTECGAKILRYDLARTGDDGEPGRSDQTGQGIMRHATPAPTISVYTHAEDRERAAALEAIPSRINKPHVPPPSVCKRSRRCWRK